jgi:SAM-dependent methyltransferase
MAKWIRQSNLDPLAVSMSGVKLADRLLVIGCSDPMLIARLAAKSGLTGRACAVDDNEDRLIEAARVAEREGALIETAHAPDLRVPYDDASFDVVVVRHTGSTTEPGLGPLGPEGLSEARRVLRPGGRCVAIGGAAPRGISGLLAKRATPDADAVTSMFTGAGFLAVRTLAERDGMLFVEGVKKNL